MAEGSGDSHSSQPEGAEALSMNELVLRLCDGLESSSLDDEQELLDGLLDQLDASAGRIGLGLDAQAWDGLVKWTFERRFGWSENADGGCRQTVDSRAKKHINDCLDQLVEMLKQQPLAPALLHALGRTAGESGKPVVRQRCYLHVYAWVKQQGAQDPEFDEQLAGSMPDLTKVLLQSLTDVWSATRKASAEKLREVVGLLAHAQLEGLVNAFFDTYATAEQLNKGPPQEQKDAWRTKEGILLGMNSILVFFGGNVERSRSTASPIRAVSSGAGSGVGAGTGGAGRGGAEADSFRKSQKTLPVFISGRLKPLLFRALAHQQLSVRETAAKAFASYLLRSAVEESMACQVEVMKKLSLGGSAMASPQQQPRSPPERLTPPPLLLAGRNRSHPALLPPRQRSEAMSFVPAPSVQSTPPQGAAAFSREMMHKWQSARELAPLEETLVEAFEAQGLLSLCGDLLERLPSRAILQSWDAWLPTFNRYLGHSASTVRQACSSLFLRLMAKTDEGAGVMQRAVLLGLSFSPQEGPLQERYSPTVDHAHAPTSPDGERGGEKRAPHHESPSAPPLLSGAPFGSASSPLLSAAFGSSPGLHETPGGAGKQGGGHWAGQTWEWREGRLLAYELVLGHLVRDHATHMFRGDVVLPPDGTPPRPFASLKVSPMQGVDDGRKGSMKNVAVSPGGGHTLASSSSSASTASNPSGSARSGGPSPGARVPSPGTRLLYFGQADAGGADAEASGAGVAAAAAGGGGEAGEVERLKRSDGGRSAGGSSGGSGKGVGLSSGVRRRGAGLLLPVQVAEDCSLLDRFRAHDGQPDDSCFPGTCSPMRSGELRGGGGVGGEAGGSEPGDEEVRGEPLGGALERMLDEVLHCIGDIRWELRRMGLQVLPLLCVTTLWYEKALLEDIWLRWLPHEAGAGRAEPPYSYVAALALKEVLKKILELSDVLQSGAAASIPPESAARVREAYVWIETLVPRLLPAIEVLLALRHPLRVGALGVELMMLIHTRLPGAAAARQREEVVLTERWIRAIYTAAHAPAALPEGAHADASAGTLLGRSASDRLGNTSPISSTEYAQEAAATPPSAGRLAGGRSSQRAAENIERALLKVVAPLIPDFVASCDVHQMLALVKVLVPYLESYHEEFEIELQVVEALQRILQLPIEIWGPELLEKSSTSQNSSTSPMGSNGPNGSNAANGSSVQTRRHSGEGSDPHTDSDAIADAPPPSQGRARRLSSGNTLFFENLPPVSEECGPRVFTSKIGRHRKFSYLRPGAALTAGERLVLADGALEDMCECCLQGLVSLIAKESTEVVLLRVILTALHSTTLLVGDGRFMGAICAKIMARLKSNGKLTPVEPEEVRHLQISSNDLPDETPQLAAIPEPGSPVSPGSPLRVSGEGGTHRPPHGFQRDSVFSQSFADRPKGRVLDVSAMLVALAPPEQVATVDEEAGGAGDAESDEGSDWDDWSEEEDVTAVEQEFALFLKSMQEEGRAHWGSSDTAPLQSMLGIRASDRRSWDQVIKDLPWSSRILIQRLLKS